MRGASVATSVRYSTEANRLGKWRTLLAGWVLGTRLDEDAQAAGMRDLQEARLLLRAEVSALTGMLVAKGLCTIEEITSAMADECAHLSKNMAGRFPGIHATDDGLEMSLPEAAETMRRLGFPQ